MYKTIKKCHITKKRPPRVGEHAGVVRNLPDTTQYTLVTVIFIWQHWHGLISH